MSFTKEAYAKLNQNKDGIRFIRPFSEYTLQEVIDALTEFEKLKELYNKQSKLLELYRLEKELKEKYHTSGSLYIMQHVLDEIRDVAEEIKQKEEELK